MARVAQQRTAVQRTEGGTGIGPPIPRFPRLPRILHAAFVYAVLILASLFILLPLGWMLTAALKPDTAPVFTFPPEWFPKEYWHWQTFRDALFKEEFIRYTANSVFLMVMTVTGAVFSSSLIAFPFARLRFSGKNVLFTFLIATMLLPTPVLLIPQFLLFYQIGWYGTYYPLWVPDLAGNPFFVFLMRQYMCNSPEKVGKLVALQRETGRRVARGTLRAFGAYQDLHRRLIARAATPLPRAPRPAWRRSGLPGR